MLLKAVGAFVVWWLLWEGDKALEDRIDVFLGVVCGLLLRWLLLKLLRVVLPNPLLLDLVYDVLEDMPETNLLRNSREGRRESILQALLKVRENHPWLRDVKLDAEVVKGPNDLDVGLFTLPANESKRDIERCADVSDTRDV